MPLQFEPGEETQVDWHEGWVIDNGRERKVQFFCMKLCYSKAPSGRDGQQHQKESKLVLCE